MRRHVAIRARLLAVLIAVSAPLEARAETFQQRAEARRIGGEALDLFKAGDYAAALDHFESADRLVPAATLKLHAARCLDKLGRMREAADRYRDTIAVELKPWSPKVHFSAREDAARELAKLLEEMPTLTITVVGQGATEAVVTLDGKVLANATLGEAQRFSPGNYGLSAKSGDIVARQDVVLARGDRKKIELVLERELAAVVDDDRGTTVVVGYAALGLGAAGLIAGGIAGGIVLSNEAGLDARCPDRRCPPSAHSDAESFERARIASSAGLIAGGAFAAAGATLVLFDAFATPAPPSAELPSGGDARAPAIRVVPVVSPMWLGVHGTFF